MNSIISWMFADGKANIKRVDKEDLIQDFVSVITSFCARIYGQRRSKRKTEKLLEGLKEDE